MCSISGFRNVAQYKATTGFGCFVIPSEVEESLAVDLRRKRRTPNAERPISNAESDFDVQSSALGVRCLLLATRGDFFEDAALSAAINGSENPLEELNAFPLPRDVRVERSALGRGAVLGRRFRVEHLERVTASHGAWHDALRCLAIDWRRRRFFCRPRVDRCGQWLRRSARDERRRHQ